jgi:hypothetical protein
VVNSIAQHFNILNVLIMIKFKQLAGNSTISEDQVVGLFSEERKGCELKTGKNATGYWVSLKNDQGGSAIFNVAKRVGAALDAALEGITDHSERLAIAIATFDQCSVIEVPDNYPLAEGETEPRQKFDEQTGEPLTRYILSVQPGAGLKEQAVNASVAKAGSFSIKAAMVNRI